MFQVVFLFFLFFLCDKQDFYVRWTRLAKWRGRRRRRGLVTSWYIEYCYCSVAGAGESEEFDAADDDFGDETEEVPVIQPNFTSVAQDFRVNIGDTVRLPCEVDKMDEELVLMWYRNQDEMLFFNKSKVGFNSTGLLTNR